MAAARLAFRQRRLPMSSTMTPAITAATISAVLVRFPTSDRSSHIPLSPPARMRTTSPPTGAGPAILAGIGGPGGVIQSAALLRSHTTPRTTTTATANETTTRCRQNFRRLQNFTGRPAVPPW